MISQHTDNTQNVTWHGKEPMWHGGWRECGTGKGATQGNGVGPTR